MAKSNIVKVLENMTEKNVDEFIFYVLYRMKDMQDSSESNKYSILSELAYVLDHKSFIDFFSLFAGQTITIPTNEEMQDIINALLFYMYKMEDSSLSETKLCQDLHIPVEKLPAIYDTIDELSDILKEYDFSKK